MPAAAYNIDPIRTRVQILVERAEESASVRHAHIVLAQECVAELREAGVGGAAMDRLEAHTAAAHACADDWPTYLREMAQSISGRCTYWQPPAEIPAPQLRLITEEVA